MFNFEVLHFNHCQMYYTALVTSLRFLAVSSADVFSS